MNRKHVIAEKFLRLTRIGTEASHQEKSQEIDGPAAGLLLSEQIFVFVGPRVVNLILNDK